MNVLQIFKKKPIHIFYPALIRLTKASTEIAPRTERGETLAQFVTAVILRHDFVLPSNASKVLEKEDLEYIGIVFSHLQEIQSSSIVTEMYQILLREIDKVYSLKQSA